MRVGEGKATYWPSSLILQLRLGSPCPGGWTGNPQAGAKVSNQNKKMFQGFPGGAVVGSLPANAGDTGSGPGLGGSHMPRSGWAREPQLFGLRVWSLCPATGGAAIVKAPRTAMKSGPAPR